MLGTSSRFLLGGSAPRGRRSAGSGRAAPRSAVVGLLLVSCSAARVPRAGTGPHEPDLTPRSARLFHEVALSLPDRPRGPVTEDWAWPR